ncbi:MAG: cupin domain-containing protein [Deltaproteobacteria bacterium]|nr:cupin domain-containing protein [Deltaproteobacteria bacterium]
MSPNQNANYWIAKLGLKPHPEGGYFKETYRSKEGISRQCLPERYSGERVFCTGIYFLIKSGEPSCFHRIKSDEIWHFYHGSPLVIHQIASNGEYSSIKMGSNPVERENFQVVVPFNHWFSAEVSHMGCFSLIGCTVSPGFDFMDFEMGDKKRLSHQFPRHEEIIARLAK